MGKVYSTGVDQARERLLKACTSPRETAFISLGAAMSISEAVRLEESCIDFKAKTLTIAQINKRTKLSCPECKTELIKTFSYCPSCGSKVVKTLSQPIIRRREKTVSIDNETLELLSNYLDWRRQFPYRGPLVFPFSRQRGSQLFKKICKRASMDNLQVTKVWAVSRRQAKQTGQEGSCKH